MSSLDKYRKQIDEIDHQIINLLNNRLKIVADIAKIKIENEMQIYVPDREFNLIENLKSYNNTVNDSEANKNENNYLSDSAINNIFQSITKECRLVQQKILASLKANKKDFDDLKCSISIQGVQGSFSENVAKNYIADKCIINPSLIYAVSSINVVKDVITGEADLGVVAIFNNWGGIVDETVEALADSHYEIVDTYKLMVKQNIIVKKGVNIKNINNIYSHSQAIAQCRKYIKQNFPSAKTHAVADTAKAAADLANGVYDSNSAVIGSIESAEQNNLDIYARSVQDKDCNETMFLIIKKKN